MQGGVHFIVIFTRIFQLITFTQVKLDLLHGLITWSQNSCFDLENFSCFHRDFYDRLIFMRTDSSFWLINSLESAFDQRLENFRCFYMKSESLNYLAVTKFCSFIS